VLLLRVSLFSFLISAGSNCPPLSQFNEPEPDFVKNVFNNNNNNNNCGC
jgi:hypothetical protein